MKKYNIIILLTLLIFPACSIFRDDPLWWLHPIPRESPGSISFAEAIKTWEGASLDELTAVWGEYSNITPNPDSYKAYWWGWSFGELTKNYPELCDENGNFAINKNEEIKCREIIVCKAAFLVQNTGIITSTKIINDTLYPSDTCEWIAKVTGPPKIRNM
jgi:hypothetical protein